MKCFRCFEFLKVLLQKKIWSVFGCLYIDIVHRRCSVYIFHFICTISHFTCRKYIQIIFNLFSLFSQYHNACLFTPVSELNKLFLRKEIGVIRHTSYYRQHTEAQRLQTIHAKQLIIIESTAEVNRPYIWFSSVSWCLKGKPQKKLFSLWQRQ